MMSSRIKLTSVRLWRLFSQQRDKEPQRYDSLPTEAQEGLLDSSSEEAKDDIPGSSVTSRRDNLWRLVAPVMWLLGCLALTLGVFAYSSSKNCSPDSDLVYCVLQSQISVYYPSLVHTPIDVVRNMSMS